MSGAIQTIWAAAVATTLAAAVGGCKEKGPTDEEILADAQRVLVASDFGEEFDKGLDLLEGLLARGLSKEIATQALYTMARAHLDLFLAAWLTKDAALYEKLKTTLSWQLDGEMRDPRNFQLLAQEILEEFRLVVREVDEGTPVALKGRALEKFCDGLQGVLFRNKKGYFEGRDAVAAIDALRWMDDLLAARDLIEEVLERSPTPGRNWQHILLTVVGRVCSATAARIVERLCTAGALAKKQDACPKEIGDVPTDVRRAAAQELKESCKVGELSGVDALRRYYQAAFNRLKKSSKALPPVLAARVEEMDNEKERALAELEKLLNP